MGAEALARLSRTMSTLVMRILIVGCYMLGISEADHLLDFPGHVICLNDSSRITLSQLLGTYRLQQLYFLNSEGEPMVCEYVVDHKNLQVIASENCMNCEATRKYLTIQFIIDTGMELVKPTYDLACEDVQEDQAFSLPTVNCTTDSMSITMSHSLPPFGEKGSRATPTATWYLEITDPVTKTKQKWSVAEAIHHGYLLSNDPVNQDLVICVLFNSTGLQKIKQDGHTLYLSEISLIYLLYNQRIQIDASMICMPGPYACNSTHLTIGIPKFPGSLSAIAIDNTDIPMNQLVQKGITLDTANGIKLYIKKSSFKNKCTAVQKKFILSLQLTFLFNGDLVEMLIYPDCQCSVPDPAVSVCNVDGFMDFEVLASSTVPKLNLGTVRVRDASCLPSSQSSDKVAFHIPLNGCGTTQRYDGVSAVYENEVRALWLDLPQSIISRDSEFRMTVICQYRGNGEAMVRADVATPLPPVTLAINDGPLTINLTLYRDSSFTNPYSDGQYPVVKFLLEPLFLEVRLLNRNDPNLELRLNYCWATASQDPASVPRWNIVVSGCENQNDNFRTVFHPVSLQVPFPSYRKRFQVKTFTFMSGDSAFVSLVYFHCTALVCNKLAPDSPLCTQICPTSRRRRETLLPFTDHLVSLPGPVIFESEILRRHKDPTDAFPADEFTASLNKGIWTIVAIVLICIVVLCVVMFKCRPK